MDNHDPAITGTALAKACDVTPQAVHGWRTTGRVHKRHLQKIAEMTGKSVEYFLEIEEPTAVVDLPSGIPDKRGFKKLLKAWEDSEESRSALLLLADSLLRISDGRKTRKRAS